MRLFATRCRLCATAACTVFVNVFGFDEDDYAEVVDKLNACDGIAAYELNISCPNTEHGGMPFGTSPATDAQLDEDAQGAHAPAR